MMEKRQVAKISAAATCTLLASLVIAIVVIVSRAKAPELSVQTVTLTKVQLQGTKSARVALNFTLQASNPNSWPLNDVTLEKAQVDVYSTDIRNPDYKDEVFIGTVSLPKPVRITNASATTFSLNFDAAVEGTSVPPLSTRLTRDCGPTSGAKETQFLFRSRDLVVKALISVKAPKDIDFSTKVGCDMLEMLAKKAEVPTAVQAKGSSLAEAADVGLKPLEQEGAGAATDDSKLARSADADAALLQVQGAQPVAGAKTAASASTLSRSGPQLPSLESKETPSRTSSIIIRAEGTVAGAQRGGRANFARRETERTALAPERLAPERKALAPSSP